VFKKQWASKLMPGKPISGNAWVISVASFSSAFAATMQSACASLVEEVTEEDHPYMLSAFFVHTNGLPLNP
jgi:hypothetical protein